ncbi:MAG: hypothetical protein ABH874_02540 [Methanobacteriota archaeon]
MGKFLLVLLIVFLAGIGYAASTVISAKGDFEKMRSENVLILITDETNKNEVELGFGFLLGSGAETFFIDPNEKTGGAPIKTLFANSIKSGAELIAGKEVSGIFDIDKNTTKNVKINRIVVIPTSVFGDAASSIGGVDYRSPEYRGIFISTYFSGEEFADLLRADSFSDTSGWEVTFTNLTGKVETQQKSGGELEKFLLESKAIDPRLHSLEVMKGMILVQAADSIDTKDKIIVGKIIEIVLNSYKNEVIQVHPGNTLTRLIKYAPVDAVKNKAVSIIA